MKRVSSWSSRWISAAVHLALFTSLVVAEAAVQVVRVGHFPNITHGQALVGHQLTRAGKGWFEPRLGTNVVVEWVVFNAGPGCMESMLSGSLDLAYVGPAPTVNAHLRTRGQDIRVVAGACSGGAAMVVKPGVQLARDQDFRGLRVATPQLGGTQDIAARAYFGSRGLAVTLGGGDLRILPMTPADQLALFQRGSIDAAWAVEPWVSRLILEGGGRVFLEEKEIWTETGGRYVTTHLTSSIQFMNTRSALLNKWVDAHVELTSWMIDNPARSAELINRELKFETTRSLDPSTLKSALQRLEFTWDPIKKSLERRARDAYSVRFLPHEPDLSMLYELGPLRRSLKARNLELVR